jgi:hypothetical protein
MLIAIALWFAFNAFLFVYLGFIRYHKWSKPSVSARVANSES